MSKYLPDDSQMTMGVKEMESEFGPISQFSGANVQVMFDAVEPNLVPGMKAMLGAYPDVNGVTYRYSEDSTATLFELDVPNDVNQKALGRQISNRFGGNCVVETSQDGATPPLAVMIVAAAMIMLVLIVMAQSWFEPIVILITAGIAIVLNVGTNALLGSVSVTTNFIGPILQAVLSLDYCIVLLNRYRQEQSDKMDRESSVLAANRAVKRAMPSILSSAFTTVVGLLMLCFMRLKIGADMGIVLAKGVAFSLLCTFTVMPSLMMLFRRTINKTAKPAYVPPTDRLARFVAAHKLPMAVGAIILAVAGWFFSQKTTIFFSEKAESKIEEVFPATNYFVLLYHTEDEDSIYDLASALIDKPEVQTIVSYPTLMTQQLTPAQMASHTHTLFTNFKDLMPEGLNIPPEMVDMSTPEMMRVVYYLRSKDSIETEMQFPELARFLHTHVASNPLFASFLDDEMRSQIAMLQTMLDDETAEHESEPQVEVQPQPQPIKPVASVETKQTEQTEDTGMIAREDIPLILLDPQPLIIRDSVVIPHIEVQKIAVVPFFEKLKAYKPSPLAIEMQKLTDTVNIRMPMNVSQMSVFMGSTPGQTKMVYGYAHSKKMTPLEYVHFLQDDLFKRKIVSAMVTDEQKRLLLQRSHLMDLANNNESLLPEDLNILLGAFGITDFLDEELLVIANPPKKEEQKVLVNVADINTEEIVNTIINVQWSLHSTDTARAEIVVPQEQVVKPKRVRKTNDDLRAELFSELAFSGKSYTAAQMSEKLNRLMNLSEIYTNPISPGQMSLLYDYYGSMQCDSCDSMHMGFENLVDYLCDTLIYDERLEGLIPPEMTSFAVNMKEMMTEGFGKLRGEKLSIFVVLSELPYESPETYAFIDTLFAAADTYLPANNYEEQIYNHYLIGRSVMYHEMKSGFGDETRRVSLFTIIAIFLIVAITFRSGIVPTILVVAVMTAVYVNVVVAGLMSGQMLYLAYLIVQAILMGASIDYGILFANYYRESRKTMLPVEAVCAAYRGSIRTILTSGLIMIIGPGAMALFVDDLMIRNIVGCLAVGAFMAVLLTLTVVPAVLVWLDKWVVYGKKNRFGNEKKQKKELKEKPQISGTGE